MKLPDICGDQWHGMFNCAEYTGLELFLFAGGCLLWVVVYAIYVKNIIKLKYIEMPVFAACGNIGWEFSWSFVLATNMGAFLVWTYKAWFFFDLFIFTGVLLYGWKQLIIPQLRRYYVPLCLISAVGWAVAVALMGKSGLDTPIGANSAYIAQMGISILYVLLLVRQTDLKNFSWAVAWLKMLGTGMNTVFMNIHDEYADNYFLRFIAILATTIDCVYIYIFWRMRRRFARQIAEAEGS